MRQLQSKMREFLLTERSRWILWVPVCFGVGIGLYFLLPQEPPLWMLAGIAGGAVLLMTGALWKGRGVVVCAVLTLAALGALNAAWRTARVDAPIIAEKMDFGIVEGVVEEITPRPDDTRLLLRVIRFDRLPPEHTPRKVSITLRGKLEKDSLHLGDTVRVKAGFFPPPLPAVPGGFQFNRHFYFQQVGANGYSFGGKPEVLARAEAQGGVFAAIAEIRQQVFNELTGAMDGRAGPVAAALTMGEQRAIPEEVFEQMRDSGLAHVLSISGLHLALAAGIFFFGLRLLFAAVPALTLHHNAKKIAAAIALLGSFAYLLLAGWPIPAQRSYVMVALVLLAVLFDRQVTPIRSLALAAMGILLFIPESVLNPSFQLSFAATLALVAYYEHWREREPAEPAPGRRSAVRRFLRYWWDIVVTSAAATAATTPFILHHFEGFPIYSVLGNLLSLSIVSFWIMPVIVLFLLLWPLGLARWLLPILEAGIHAMLAMAQWVAGLPYAVVDAPPLSMGALVLCAAGGLWLCLWQGKPRHVGWLPIAAGLMSLAWYQPPDMFIGDDGSKIAVRAGAEKMVMLQGRSEGFQQDQWLRFAQVESFARRSKSEDTVRCDALGCRWRWNGQEVAITQEREALWEDCGEARLVVTPEWSVRKVQCKALLFDRARLQREGGAVFWLEPEDIRYRTVRQAIGDRPWTRRLGAD